MFSRRRLIDFPAGAATLVLPSARYALPTSTLSTKTCTLSCVFIDVNPMLVASNPAALVPAGAAAASGVAAAWVVVEVWYKTKPYQLFKSSIDGKEAPAPTATLQVPRLARFANSKADSVSVTLP